jgi:hypothetical protein
MGPRKRVGPDRETMRGREVFGMKQYAWSILVVAGVFETGFSIGLKCSAGFTRFWSSIAVSLSS